MDAGVTQSKGKEFVEYLVFILVVRTQSLEVGLDSNPQQPPPQDPTLPARQHKLHK